MHKQPKHTPVTMRLPRRSRICQCHLLDSTRWNHFHARTSDIIVASSYKAGTTWVQAIVAHLLGPDGTFSGTLSERSPWLEARYTSLHGTLATLRGQTERRFIKTHLPLDALPYDEQVKYIYVGRDGRDIFMSLWNHFSNMTDESVTLINQLLAPDLPAFPDGPTDIHTFWDHWLRRGLMRGESSGWPYWSLFSNIQSWWPYRDLHNIRFVHYNDLLGDIRSQVLGIADFLEIDVSASLLERIVDAVSFPEMKRRGDQYAPGMGRFWKGGAETFFYRGTNGRWQKVLSPEELNAYDRVCQEALDPECRAWLEAGAGNAQAQAGNRRGAVDRAGPVESSWAHFLSGAAE
jgi:aryl sulfotransferase